MKNLFRVLLCAGLFGVIFVGFETAAQEGPITAKILRVPRPNVVVAEVYYGGQVSQVRIRLAGVDPPLRFPEIYQQGQRELRKMVANQEVFFDFALGFGPDGSIWIGYLYIPCQSDGEEDWIIVNEELIRMGLAEVDEKTAGANQLVYLQSLEDEARENLLELWQEQEKMAQATWRLSDDVCTVCIR